MSTDAGLFRFEQTPLLTRVAQVVGITASAFVSGQIASSTYILLPCILRSPAPLLAKQWEVAHKIAGTTSAPMAVGSAIAFAYLASQAATTEETTSTAFKLYTLAAILVPSMIPFTLAVMGPLNNKLFKRADVFTGPFAGKSLTDTEAEKGVSKEETTHALVDKWGTLNLVKAVLNGVGGICALWAVVSKGEVQAFGIRGLGFNLGADRMGH